MTPSGIIMQSSSVGATPEAIEAVLEKHGYETEKPEPVEAAEPKRDDFESDEAFATAQEEFETAQEAAAEAETEEEEAKPKPVAAKPSRKQRAIDKATRELKEENRKLAERVQALEGGRKPAEARAVAQAVEKIEVPQREKFKTDAEFEEAMFDYRYQVRRAKEAASAAQERITAQLKENLESYQSSVADFKAEHDDWDEVVNQSIPIHESVFLAVMELENGPQVTYYLGKHPDFARELAEMTPLSAAMEVGRLSTRLKTGAPDPQNGRPGAAGNGAKPKPKTRLPEPVTPVRTAATSSTLTSAEAARKRDYRGFKRAQRAGR